MVLSSLLGLVCPLGSAPLGQQVAHEAHRWDAQPPGRRSLQKLRGGPGAWVLLSLLRRGLSPGFLPLRFPIVVLVLCNTVTGHWRMCRKDVALLPPTLLALFSWFWASYSTDS